MEKLEENNCRLCLITINDEKTKVIEGSTKDVFIFVFPSLQLEGHSQILCSACSTKLFHAYNFKAACQETEDIIAPYVNSENELIRDFKAIYVIDRIEKGFGGINSALEDLQVCRLCMQLVLDKFIKVEDNSQIEEFILEVQNFKVTSNSIICLKCSDSLITSSNFMKNCLSKQISLYIKSEEIYIKSEIENDNEKSSETQLIDARFEPTEQTSVPSTTRMYKCDKCPYENKHKYYLKTHELVHKDKSEVLTYKCGECKFESKRRNDLCIHQVLHKSSSEVPIYKCNQCEYQGKRKQYLNNHMMKHIDPPYKCDKCNFMTRYSGTFAVHQKQHEKYTYTCCKCGVEKTLKQASKQKADMFKCNICILETLQMQHEEKSLYRCDKCEFTTRYKGKLVIHQKKHEACTFTCHKCGAEEKVQRPFKRKNSVEARMYKCSSCRNKTPQADPLVPQLHKCNECDFETEFRQRLIIHQSSHNVAWGVQRYKCEECNLESRFKVMFQLQQFTHKDPSEGPMYKCTECPFVTKLKDDLRVHLLRHQASSEVRIYKCNKCKLKPNEVLDADVPMQENRT